MEIIKERHADYRKSSAIGRCDCGREVELYGFTNTCGCGRDYNMSGQLLAPRSQWGEETGESVADILAIDGMTTEELLEGGDQHGQTTIRRADTVRP